MCFGFTTQMRNKSFQIKMKHKTEVKNINETESKDAEKILDKAIESNELLKKNPNSSQQKQNFKTEETQINQAESKGFKNDSRQTKSNKIQMQYKIPTYFTHNRLPKYQQPIFVCPASPYDIQYTQWLREQNEFLMKQVRFLQDNVHFWTEQNMQLRGQVYYLENKLIEKEREIEEYKDIADEIPFIFHEYLIGKLANDISKSDV